MTIDFNVYPTDGFIDVLVGAAYRERVHRVVTDTETGVVTITPNSVDGEWAHLDWDPA